MLDWGVALTGLVVGLIVGMTGMGGGALMMPALVLLFHAQPLAAVSSDVVASLIMRPVGAWLHMRRGTANVKLATWLIIGSVLPAFAGVVLLRGVAAGPHLQQFVTLAVGVALLLVAAGFIIRPWILRFRPQQEARPIEVKPIPTLLVGVFGGLICGTTSIGSGSLMMILLLLLYPRLRLAELVGTDLLQAAPLLASAALGHILFGHVDIGLTASIVLGGIPGIYLGARVSSRAPEHVIRPALVIVLFATGLKMVGVHTPVLLGIVVIGLVLGVASIIVAESRAARIREEAANSEASCQ